jgi:hypothetical protein
MDGRLMERPRTDTQADLQWCFEPVYQSGPDIASNPRLLPASFAEHEEQIAATFDVHRCRPQRRFAMDTMYRCYAGLDVQKETVAVCVRRVDSAAGPDRGL